MRRFALVKTGLSMKIKKIAQIVLLSAILAITQGFASHVEVIETKFLNVYVQLGNTMI